MADRICLCLWGLVMAWANLAFWPGLSLVHSCFAGGEVECAAGSHKLSLLRPFLIATDYENLTFSWVPSLKLGI